MQGNVVTAARWVGISMVLASVILVGRLRWALSPRVERPAAPTASARVEERLAKSKKLRESGDEYERFWFLDQPSHMTPFRTHGGLGP